MNGLIGYTGFVGGNLDRLYDFEKKYNSKNIDDIKGNQFDILVCAGVSAVKWFANQNPEKDVQAIDALIENLKTIKAKKFVLISTIDIYDKTVDVDEEYIPNVDKQDAYGKNRYYLENWVKENFEDYLILRLPALFGTGLKKNFIYDLMNRIPAIIISKKFDEIKDIFNDRALELLTKAYDQDDNGNYKFNNLLTTEDYKELLKNLEDIGFTSLVFTDCRSKFPFYNLENIWKDIQKAMDLGIKVLNLSVEPLDCKLIADRCLNIDFNNVIEGRDPLTYDMKSIHADAFGGNNGYLYSKEESLTEIDAFVHQLMK